MADLRSADWERDREVRGAEQAEEWQRRLDSLRRDQEQLRKERDTAIAQLRNARLDHQAALRQIERERQTLAQAESQRDLLMNTIERLRRQVAGVRASQREIEQQHASRLAEVEQAHCAVPSGHHSSTNDLDALVSVTAGAGKRTGEARRLGAHDIDAASATARPVSGEGDAALRRELEEAQEACRRMEDEIADLNGRLVEMMNASTRQLRDLIRQHHDAEQSWKAERIRLDPTAAVPTDPAGDAVDCGLFVLDETPRGDDLAARISLAGISSRRPPHDPGMGVEVEQWMGRPTAINLAVSSSWGAVRRLVWRCVTPVAPFYGYAMLPDGSAAFWLGPVSFALLTHGAHGIGPVLRQLVPHAETVVTIGDEPLMAKLQGDLDHSQVTASFARDGNEARQRMAAREPDAIIVHCATNVPRIWQNLFDLRTYVVGNDLPILFLLNAETRPEEARALSEGMQQLARAGRLSADEIAQTLAAELKSAGQPSPAF